MDAVVKDLTPCPWCGDTSGQVVQTRSTFRWRAMQCETCGIQGPEVRIQTMGEGTKEQLEANARDRAIAEWNNRAPAIKPAAGRRSGGE